MYIRIAICLFFPACLFAQKNTVSSGGTAHGLDGTACYSIGQIDFITATGAQNTITQGLQQTYDLIVVSGIEHTYIQLEAVAFPNPVYEYLELNVTSIESEIQYELINISGAVIQKKKMGGEKEDIYMKELESGIYFLIVTDTKKSITKTFKIIKSQ